jgi:uncharacterized protein DUF998
MQTSFMKPATGNELQKNILATYFTMRGGMVLFSSLFPLVLLLYSLRAHQGTLSESSISAYYGADGGAMRNYFVATLCVVGALLAVYKGFSLLENILLKIAGVSVSLVAFFPCHCWHGGESKNFSHYAHGTVAAAFFVSMILVLELCAMDTITLLDTKALQDKFRYAYHTIALSLFVAVGASVVVNFIAGLGSKSIFAPEMAGVLVFAVYWFAKSREFHYTAAEKKAAGGQIAKINGRLFDMTNPKQIQEASLEREAGREP